MLFASFSFIVFLLIFIVLYFLTPSKFKWIALLLGTFYFIISSKPEWIILIILSIIFNYLIGIYIYRSININKRKAKILMIIGIVFNLLYLITFKYLNFLSSSLRDLFGIFNINFSISYISILLPIGISFYTFQNISY